MVTQSIPLVADLRTQNRNIGTIYLATGLVTEGDTGGGIYFWNPASTNADDGFYYLQVTGVTTGRWVRIYAGSNIYNTDGSLLDNRDVTLNGNYLKFIGSSANSTFNADGSVTLGSLSGVNTRMVVAGSTGTLSTQSFVPGTTIRFVEKFTAIAGQTVFNTANTLYGDLFDVFLNGVKLNTDSFSFTANQITLLDGSYVGDIIDVVGFSSITVYATLPSQAGNAGKYLFTDGTNISWQLSSGGISSIGLSMPSAFTVSNSPLTANGTISVIGAGTTAQYIRGDGSLATFPALTGYIPYTGATTNVDLGEFGIRAGQFTLDTSPTGTAAVGTTRWNDTIGSSETTLKGGSVILKNGVDLVARIVNKVTPNATLTKAAYQAVRVSGAQGQRLAVAYAQANNDANSADTIGLVCETIPTNQEGFIITMGQIENINTTGSLQGETWVDGDVLYLSPTTPGAITKVKPTGAGHIVVIGYVEYAHVNNGKIYVKVMNGWELDELHDVDIVSPTNNEALIYESSTSLWKNKTIATALGYTPISGTGATGQVAYWNGTNSQTGSNNLFWDAANGRLGIGTNAPDFTIKSQKSVPAGYDGIVHKNTSSTGIAAISVQGSAASNNDLSIFVCSPSQTIRSTFGLTGNYSELVANTANGFAMGTYTATPFIIGTNNTARLTIFGSTGNLVLQNGGTFTDGGQRLQVQGNVYVNGTYVGTNTVETTGTFYSRGSNSGFRFSDGASGIIDTGSSIQFRNYIVAPYQFTYQYGERTSGIRNIIEIPVNVNPTSGTAIYNMLVANPTINQTGGANGITRGLYVNPTLTAAADWRSIEWSNNSGWGLYGAGTANNYLAGRLLIKTSTIGTFDLDVNGTARVSDTVSITSNTSTSYALNIIGRTTAGNASTINFFNNAASTRYGFVYVDSSSFEIGSITGSNIPLIFSTNQSENMRLTSGGNLLVGTTVDSGYKLDVNGTARVTGSANTILTLNSTNGTGYSAIKIDASGVEKALIGFGTYLTSDAGVAIRTAASTPFTIAIGGGVPTLTLATSGAATFSSSVTATSFIKSGGTSSQYLMADGSVTTGGGGSVDELQVSLICQVFG